MSDADVAKLIGEKRQLLERAYELLEQIKEREERREQLPKSQLPSTCMNKRTKESLDANLHRLCVYSSHVTGVNFENVNRKWIKGNLYEYTTDLITKAIGINVILEVEMQNEHDFQIQSIKCSYKNINKCYIIEIKKWVKKITNMNNFSLLVSALSQYSKESEFRFKIIKGLVSAKYAISEECDKHKGGILLYIYSPKNMDKVCLQFQWSLKFVKTLWRVEHVFVINSHQAETGFAEKNKELLTKFCQRGISKDELKKLWAQLCSAVNEYENAYETQLD